MTAVAAASVGVELSAEQTFAALVDWEAQGEWMPATRVEHAGGPRHGIGGTLRAITGVGRLGIVDDMEIVDWQPGSSCTVRHTGRLLRGTAIFSVESVGAARSVFRWEERLDPPFRPRVPVLGPAADAVFGLGVRLLLRPGLAVAVRRFARWAPGRVAS